MWPRREVLVEKREEGVLRWVSRSKGVERRGTDLVFGGEVREHAERDGWDGDVSGNAANSGTNDATTRDDARCFCAWQSAMNT